MAEMRGANILLHEIEKAKDKLKDVNENIKKLTGRDPEDLKAARGRVESRGRGRLFNLARRAIMPEESGGGPSPAKRRNTGGAFARLGPMPARRRVREDSGDEDDLRTKLTVQSSVVATSRDARSREESLAEQSSDREGMQRNRRMFGLLLGTLQKFKTEAQAQGQKEERRRKIEKKLEADAEREKQLYRKETQQLIEESQAEQARITRLQQKMELVTEHEALVAETKKLNNFICTRARPRIFWLPKSMTSTAEAKLKESKKVVDRMLKEKSDALEREINEVMEREERIRSRLRHDSTGTLDKENAGDEHRSRSEEREPSREHSKGSKEKSKEGHRHRKSSHHEAKKTQPEMHYEDEEEETGEEDEGSHIELGEREAGPALPPAGGQGGKKGEKMEVEESGKGKNREGRKGEEEEEEEEQAPKKPDQMLSSFDDGNTTDVDYDDDETHHNTAEGPTSFNLALNAIPLPDDVQVPSKSTQSDDSRQMRDISEEDRFGDRSSGMSEVREEQLYLERGQEMLRTTAVMAEDEADMDEDPNDE